MKKLVVLLFFVGLTGYTMAQDEAKKMPSVQIKSMDGSNFNTSSLNNEGKPMIINFWATWCLPCKKELNAINEVYPDWVDETGVKIVAISIDNSRTRSNIMPYVNFKGWEYEIYNDQNSEFFQALGGVTPPLTFLLDGDGNIVYTHNGYAPGDEEELYEKLLELIE